MMHITFKPLAESDFPLLLAWLESPHVKKWWDPDVVYTLDTVQKKYRSAEREHIQAYIIYVDERPVGYIQLYNAYDFPRSTLLSGLSASLGALDMFIGDINVVGKGLAAPILQAFLAEHGQQYSSILVDPAVGNKAAIRVYEKAGFQKIAEQAATGEVLLVYREQKL